MRLANILRWLVCLAIGLPMVALVLQFAARLLAVMGDEPGARVVRGIAVGCGVLWAVSLVGIVIVTAMETLRRDEPPRGPS